LLFIRTSPKSTKTLANESLKYHPHYQRKNSQQLIAHDPVVRVNKRCMTASTRRLFAEAGQEQKETKETKKGAGWLMRPVTDWFVERPSCCKQVSRKGAEAQRGEPLRRLFASGDEIVWEVSDANRTADDTARLRAAAKRGTADQADGADRFCEWTVEVLPQRTLRTQSGSKNEAVNRRKPRERRGSDDSLLRSHRARRLWIVDHGEARAGQAAMWRRLVRRGAVDSMRVAS
jgi:hypothetical protein